MPTPTPNRLFTEKPLLLALLLIPLFLSWSLSPSLAVAGTIVTHLPGFNGPLPFYLETGYVNVDEENGSEYFYYFIKSKGNPARDPVILWLSGGPGCTSFNGLVFEIGPIRFVSAEYNGSMPDLVYHPYEWTKLANIIFLDSPVGSGFSFSTRVEGYNEGDISWSKHAHKFLIKWLGDRAMLLRNPLYIAGDSYAGKIVPLVAQEIANGLENGIKPVLNLKGYLIGNPITGSEFDMNSRIPYAHGLGIISTQFYEEAERWCHGQDYRDPNTAECAKCIDAFEKVISEINIQHILEPNCPRLSPRPKDVMRGRIILEDEDWQLFDPPVPPPLYCRSYAHFLVYVWANSDDTRRALNIKKRTVVEWQRCNRNLPHIFDVGSTINVHLNLTTRGYRALVYSGDHDLAVPFLGTDEWIRSLNFPVVSEWRSWHVRGQVAGYTVTYSNNLTFATVKNGGHDAPWYTPEQCFAMFQRWISHEAL